MADGASPDLAALTDAADIAAQARQDQFNLYNQARAAGDLDGLTAHYQGYKSALAAEQKANEVLGQTLLNSPTLVTDLAMLAKANQTLSDSAEALKTDIKTLGAFTDAANAVLTVLGAIAAL